MGKCRPSGLQPTMGRASGLEERIANTDYRRHHLKSRRLYVPADDFTDRRRCIPFSHLSASIVPPRKRASEGLFPSSTR